MDQDSNLVSLSQEKNISDIDTKVSGMIMNKVSDYMNNAYSQVISQELNLSNSTQN